MAEFERSTAKLCNINEIINGKYIKTEGWDPNFVVTDYGKIARANILGVIVSKENNSCILDDGSSKIRILNFNGPINEEIGQLVTVIGKPRLFNNEIFLNAEIVKALKNKKWAEFRKKELELRAKQKIDIVQEEYIDDNKTNLNENKVLKEDTGKPETIEKLEIDDILNDEVEQPQVMGKAEKIIKLIESLDSEEGAPMTEVIQKAGFDDAEKIIKNLIEEGEIFQIKPGRLKIL